MQASVMSWLVNAGLLGARKTLNALDCSTSLPEMWDTLQLVY